MMRGGGMSLLAVLQLLLLLLAAALCVAHADDPDLSAAFEEYFPKGEGLDPPADMMVAENIEVAGRVFTGCDPAADQCVRWMGSEGSKHLYLLYNTKKTWYHAKRSCEAVGGYLVTVTSPEEMVFLKDSFGFDVEGQWGDWMGPWIGYTDAGNKGKWHWVTGEIAVTGQDTVYHNWYPNEPDNCCGGEDCAHVSGGHWGDKWNDAKCHYQLPYICEKDF